ncbi:MAG TPA: hypothetical protein VFD17_01905 [Clostridia bacterium]|nr:hypothetical protein [Clostridia bacterium]
MAWYHGTFSCGCEGRVNVIGPAKDRQWKIDRKFEGMCEDCWEKHMKEQREIANAEAAEKAKEMELPELTGSEKQIAWANTLRQGLLDSFYEFMGNERRMERLSENDGLSEEDVARILDYILENKTNSRFFIDNRNEDIRQIIRREAEEALKSDEEIYEEKLLEEERISSIVYPEDRVTDVPVEIMFSENRIDLRFEKNEDFRLLVRDLGYTWGSGTWYRTLDNTTGGYRDRVAEVGNKLLNKGFPVMILGEELRNMAISGEYEQECTRWIYAMVSGDYKGQFAIKWKGRNEKLYKTARSLPGSRWDSAVMVRVEHYKEVEEFAELYGFKFTNAALRLITEYKEAAENIEVVEPAQAEEETETDGLKEILQSGNEVLEDLKDD